MRNLLGGKGANLAEMNLIGVPVPPGFTITTEVCTEYYEIGKEKVVALLKDEVEKSIANIEKLMNSKFGDTENPLLVSVRSGARASMPGMMDTILNLGLNDEVVEGLVRKTNNPRFAWDSYRRFVQMYGDVVLGMKPTNKDDIDPFEAIIEEIKEKKGVKLDNELDVDDLKELVLRFKKRVKSQTGQDFPTSAYEQLWGAICAVFNSWMNERAILYRKMEGIPSEWGTAVTVQAMVFGNMGDTSATGVCFSRDAANGEDLFNGEYLINAQGEDVVAGIRTPQQITKIGSRRWAERAGITEDIRKTKYPSMEETMPEIYKELDAIQTKLEQHYRDMQDMEFTVQEGKLWFLQTRNGKRTGAAMVKIAMDLVRQGMITEQEALLRIEPNKLDELLHPVFDKEALKRANVLTRGLPASPGAATGQIVFFADDAAKWSADGHKVVMVRIETSPEDLAGMAVAEGILTARGGMTSHAAVVARGMGKCCVSGAGALNVDYKARTVEIDGVVLKEGDYISLNGTSGEVYQGEVETKAAELSGDFAELMRIADKYTKLQVRTNADTPHDAKVARSFGAVGIGLCRTEHMFFEGEKIKAMREMILAEDTEGRKKALDKILPYQKEDFKGIFRAMSGFPVTVRLLDPPLHEFVPHDIKGQEDMAKAMGVSVQYIQKRVESLCEHNPMLGHRGCRLGNTYPEITEMQTRAILGAALELKKEGVEEFGLHAFLASNTLGNDYYEELARVLFNAIASITAEYGVKFTFVNLSGGVGVPYRPEQPENDIFVISEGVKKAYEEILAPKGIKPRICTELGRYMLAPYGGLVTRAIHEKHIYKEYIGVDACSANLMRPAMYGAYHHITVLGKENEPCDHIYDVVGSLCENSDKFAVDRALPKINTGDLLFIHDTGAHGFSMGYNYNGRLRSAEILLKPDGTYRLIRRAETPSDYFATLTFLPEFEKYGK